MHCILKWLESQQTCCMCRRPWEFRSEESADESNENNNNPNNANNSEINNQQGPQEAEV